jgi:ABC-type transport system substrate-binding protein
VPTITPRTWPTAEPDRAGHYANPALGVALDYYGVYHLRFILAVRGDYAFAVFIEIPPAQYKLERATFDQLVDSLTLDEPRLYGLARADTLVLDGVEPITLDPALQPGSGADLVGRLLVGHIFSGLVTLNPQMQVVPDLAESWDISDDGRTYTFHLRHGVTFHNGRPFTAADVRYSLERATDPALQSPTAETYLGDIAGVPERLAGQAPSISGLQVFDDYTLALTIDEPKAYFLAKLSHPVAWVVDRENVAAGAQRWRRPNGTGPFVLAAWRRNEVMIFDRDPHYDRGPAALAHVLVRLYAGLPLQLYELGDVDVAPVLGADVSRVLDPQDPLNHDLVSAPAFCTTRLVFDPAAVLDVLYHSGGRNNLGHYSNPEVDRLLEQARVERDVERRLAFYRQVEQLVLADDASLPMFHGYYSDSICRLAYSMAPSGWGASACGALMTAHGCGRIGPSAPIV